MFEAKTCMLGFEGTNVLYFSVLLQAVEHGHPEYIAHFMIAYLCLLHWCSSVLLIA